MYVHTHIHTPRKFYKTILLASLWILQVKFKHNYEVKVFMFHIQSFWFVLNVLVCLPFCDFTQKKKVQNPIFFFYQFVIVLLCSELKIVSFRVKTEVPSPMRGNASTTSQGDQR